MQAKLTGKTFVISRGCREHFPFNSQERAKHLVLLIFSRGLNICETFTDVNYISLGPSIGICLESWILSRKVKKQSVEISWGGGGGNSILR